MKSLPMLAVVALFPVALFPVALSAQTTSTPVSSLILYAESVAPAAYSTSSLDAPAAPSAPSAPAASSAASDSSSAADAHSSGSVRPFSAIGIGVKVGSTGIGFDVATPLMKRLNIRGGAGFFSYNYSTTIDNDPVNATLKLDNADAVVDLFPFNGGFRLSAGATFHNQAALNGTLTTPGGSQIMVGNTVYTSSTAKQLTGSMAAAFGNNVVPRFTFGWGNMVPRHGHFRFESEFGVEVTGAPTAVWSYAGNACPGTPSTCTTTTGTVAASDIAVQNANLQSDISGYKVFPIFSIGLSYKIGR